MKAAVNARFRTDLAVDLYFAPLSPMDREGEEAIGAMMSPSEIERAQRFRHEPSRICYLLTRRLVRETLSELGGRAPGEWRFRIGEHGRPSLENPTSPVEDLDFNIAHSREKIVLAVTKRGRIGVDLEPSNRRVDHESVASRFFNKVECADLEELDEDRRRRRFLQLWVLKEAWLKADGRGLSAGLHRVVFRFDTRGRPRLVDLPDDDPRCWQIDLGEVGGDHLLGLALRTPR